MKKAELEQEVKNLKKELAERNMEFVEALEETIYDRMEIDQLNDKIHSALMLLHGYLFVLVSQAPENVLTEDGRIDVQKPGVTPPMAMMVKIQQILDGEEECQE